MKEELIKRICFSTVLKREKSKKLRFLFPLLMALVMMAMSPTTAWAEIYISDIAIGGNSNNGDEGSTAAKKELTNAGYTVVDCDLNSGTKGWWIYVGYKTTTDPTKAIRDIILVDQLTGDILGGHLESDGESAAILNKVNECKYYRAKSFSTSNLNRGFSEGSDLTFYYTRDSRAGAPINRLNGTTEYGLSGYDYPKPMYYYSTTNKFSGYEYYAYQAADYHSTNYSINVTKQHRYLIMHRHSYNASGYCTTVTNETHYKSPDVGDGSASNPYQITSAANLLWYAGVINDHSDQHPVHNLEACAVLKNDITLSGKWTKIGNYNNYYKGTFDGENHTISGFDMDVTVWEEGFFGFTQNATIKNLTVNGTMTSTTTNSNCRSAIGGVVGLAKGKCTIENVHSNVNITMNHNNNKFIGGVVGDIQYVNGMTGSVVKDCSYSGTITLNSNIGMVAGIVGHVDAPATISDCVFNGTINTCGNCQYTGGIVGMTEGSNGNLDILRCSNYGSIDFVNSWDCCGGIAGYVQWDSKALIENCLFAGTLKANTTDGRLCMGGIVGLNSDDHENFRGIKNCLSCGNFTYNTSNGRKPGAIVGYTSGNTPQRITNNYYKEGTAPVVATSGSSSLPNTNVSRTDAQIKSGQVCYELNNSVSGGTPWRQTIAVDNIPFLDETHSKVYRVTTYCDGTAATAAYSNETKLHKSYATNGVCSSCKAGGAQPSGLGTTASPYLIANAGNLLWLRNLVNAGITPTHARLTADIDMDGISWSNAIGENTDGYTCTFDGNGHSIKNMNYGTSVYKVGDGSNRLFATIGTGGKLTNLDCQNINIVLSISNMALVGINYGTIEKVQMHEGTCQYHVASGPRGGICAQNYGTIDNCGIYDISFRNRRGSDNPWLYMGAICGINHDNAIIRNCYTWGVKYVDGFDGYNAILDPKQTQSGTVTNCYTDNIGTAIDGVTATWINANDVIYGRLAYGLNGGVTNGNQAWYQLIGTETFPHCQKASNKYVYKGACGGNVFGYSNSSSVASHTFGDYDSNGLHQCSKCSRYEGKEPTLSNGTYQIANAGNLLWFSRKVNGMNDLVADPTIKGKLTADIDYSKLVSPEYMIGWNTNTPYQGTFDGNYKKVTVAFNTAEERSALFRNVTGATIQNLHTSGSVTTSRKYAAGVIAYEYGTTILNKVWSDVNIISTVSGDGTHGGLVGVSSGSTQFTDCAFTGKFTGSGTSCWGGMTGWAATGDLYKGNIVILDANSSYNSKSSCTFARGTVANGGERNYYLTAVGSGQGEVMTAAQFASGEVCYLLNNKTNGGTTWYQNLASGGNAYPVLNNTSYKVYMYTHTECNGTVNKLYTNSSSQKSYTDPHVIGLANGLCTKCSTDMKVTTSYRKPTYNTAGDAKSGIASWETVSDVKAIPLPSSDDRQTWYGQTYVVQSGQTVNLTAGAICSGAVNLILEDGATLNVTSGAEGNAGINVTGSNSLTINGQQKNSGKLVANSKYKNGAAIGGDNDQEGANITINGGDITADSHSNISGAGIGGGCNKAGHNIIINGGTINAQSNRAAGIGGGSNSNGYNIFINGGTITAIDKYTSNGSAGIGGGDYANGYNITITGGTIAATGASFAAGIGGGYCGKGYNISITGGTITATGSNGADGIGYGINATSSDNYKNITFAPKMGIMSGSTVITNTGGDMYASIHGKSSISVHEHTGFTYDNNAGCTTVGTQSTSCTTCNLDKVTITDPDHPALGHGSTGYTPTYTWGGTYDAATCTFSLKCDKCSNDVVTDQSMTTSINELSHKVATCTVAGNESWTVAGGSYSKTGDASYTGTKQSKSYDIPALGHDFTAKTLSASADANGLYSYVCAHDGSHLSDVKVIKDYAPAADGNAKHLELSLEAGYFYSTSTNIALHDDNQFAGVGKVYISTPAKPTYKRHMSGEWGTLVLPFSADVTQLSGCQLYKIVRYNGSFVLSLCEDNVKAGTPVFIRRTTDEQTIIITASNKYVYTSELSTDVAPFTMCGTYQTTELSAGDYILYNNAMWNVDAFNGSAVKAAPFRAYLKSHGVSNVKMISFTLDDEEETTSINNEQLIINNDVDAVYNLNGQKLDAPRKGVNIINGRKVLVK